MSHFFFFFFFEDFPQCHLSCSIGPGLVTSSGAPCLPSCHVFTSGPVSSQNLIDALHQSDHSPHYFKKLAWTSVTGPEACSLLSSHLQTRHRRHVPDVPASVIHSQKQELILSPSVRETAGPGYSCNALIYQIITNRSTHSRGPHVENTFTI